MIYHNKLGLVWALVVLFCESVAQGKSRQEIFTIKVEPGAKDCLFIPDIAEGYTFNLDFEVTDSSGATGNLDITVNVWDPQGNSAARSIKKDSDEIFLDIKVPGDYKVCIDNRFSTFSAKNVAIQIQITDPMDDYYDDYIEDELMERMQAMNSDNADLVTAIRDKLYFIKRNIRTASHLQDQLIFSNTQDIKMSENNSRKVTLWSVIHLSFLIAVGLIQVGMVKNLFSDKSFIHKFVTKGGRSDQTS